MVAEAPISVNPATITRFAPWTESRPIVDERNRLIATVECRRELSYIHNPNQLARTPCSEGCSVFQLADRPVLLVIEHQLHRMRMRLPKVLGYSVPEQVAAPLRLLRRKPKYSCSRRE